MVKIFPVHKVEIISRFFGHAFNPSFQLQGRNITTVTLHHYCQIRPLLLLVERHFPKFQTPQNLDPLLNPRVQAPLHQVAAVLHENSLLVSCILSSKSGQLASSASFFSGGRAIPSDSFTATLLITLSITQFFSA